MRTSSILEAAKYACAKGPSALRKAIRLACLTGTMLIPASIQAAESGSSQCPAKRPAFPLLTYDEEDRYLANMKCRTEPLDFLKFIPLRKGSEKSYLSIGAFTRERGEYVSHPTWANTPPGSNYLLQRIYLHTDFHFQPRFRFFGELGSSLEYGRDGGPRPVYDKDVLYVHQGFFDIGILRSERNALTFRAGRQEMSLGAENLVSTRDGRNVRRSLDGGRLRWQPRDWTIDFLALRQTQSTPGIFDDQPNHLTSFWGVYAAGLFPRSPKRNINLYYLGLDEKGNIYERGPGREQRTTIGGRLWGAANHLSYDYEPTFQWGAFGPGAIRAWGVTTVTDLEFAAPLRPKLSLKADSYSGDQNPDGRTLGTFNALYEKGPYYSYAELYGRRNLIALQPSLKLELRKTMTLTPNVGLFWRESTRDGLYAVAVSSLVVSGRKSNARFIGTQAATQFQWHIDRHFTLFAEYLHFFPGEFLTQSTQGKNIDYVTEWLDFKF